MRTSEIEINPSPQRAVRSYITLYPFVHTIPIRAHLFRVV